MQPARFGMPRVNQRSASHRRIAGLLAAGLALAALSGCASKELAREAKALEDWHQDPQRGFAAVMDDHRMSYRSAVEVHIEAVVNRTRAERQRSLYELALRRLAECEAEVAGNVEQEFQDGSSAFHERLTLAQVEGPRGQGNELHKRVLLDELNRLTRNVAVDRAHRVAEVRARILRVLAEGIEALQAAGEGALNNSNNCMEDAASTFRQKRLCTEELKRADHRVEGVINSMRERANRSFFDRLTKRFSKQPCCDDKETGNDDEATPRNVVEEGNAFIAHIQEAAQNAEADSLRRLQRTFEARQCKLALASCSVGKNQGQDAQCPAVIEKEGESAKSPGCRKPEPQDCGECPDRAEPNC